MPEPEAELASFLARYAPDIAEVGREAIARLRARLPNCDALVYDNYNALAVGFSPDGKTGSSVLSVALYPRWVSLFVSARLDDPQRILKGGGAKVRHVVLKGGASDLDQPAIASFVDQTIDLLGERLDPARQGMLVIKSISAKQRLRRPG